MNPEVFESFRVGERFKSGDLEDLHRVLESFINDYDKNAPLYAKDLAEAAELYSPENFARRIAAILEK